MSEGEEVSEKQYITFELGEELHYSTNLDSVRDVIFWVEIFKSRILEQLFEEVSPTEES